MSLHIVKFLSRPLSVISAALLIHVGGALAADSAGDAQQQARELLAGRSATQSTLPSERRADRAARPTADAQELARRVLLGVTDAGVQGTKPMTRPDNAAAPVESTVQKSVLTHGDAQAMARRLLLGQASAAGS
jgi:hypothetical protein